MATLDCAFVTFNAARVLLDVPYFSACLFDTLSKRDTPPELIALSLQEIAPIGYSFLGGSFLTPYFGKFESAINETAKKWEQDGLKYESVLATNVGMTGLMLFAQPDIVSRIRWSETAGASFGKLGMGNKGAVGVRLGYANQEDEEVEMTFVAAHLAPMEEAVEKRNQDWRTANEDMVFVWNKKSPTSKIQSKSADAPSTEEAEPLLSSATDPSTESDGSRQQSGLIKASSYLFLAGDLNYRTSDTKPSDDAHKSWPQPASSASDSHHYSQWFERDQLNREQKAGKTLHGLHEAPITFAPTYKYSAAAQAQAAKLAEKQKDKTTLISDHAVEADNQDLWATHRYPSWCDRILYLEPPFSGTQPIIHSYTSLPLQPSSDHKPVVLQFSIPLKPLPKETVPWIKSPFAIAWDWEELRATARRREIAVGLASYLALTWEGEALLLGTLVGAIGGFLVLRSLLV